MPSPQTEPVAHLVACVEQLLTHVEPLVENGDQKKQDAMLNFCCIRTKLALAILKDLPPRSLQRFPVRGNGPRQECKPGSGSGEQPVQRYSRADADAVNAPSSVSPGPATFFGFINKDMDRLQRATGEWANRRYPDATPGSIFERLSQELHIDMQKETKETAAGCVLLLLELAHWLGFSLFDEAAQELQVCEWQSEWLRKSKENSDPKITAEGV